MGSGPGTESAPSPCRTSWLTNLDGRALLAVVLAHYVPSEYFPNAPPANCHPLVKSGPRKQVKLNRGTLFAPVLKLRTAEHPGNWQVIRRLETRRPGISADERKGTPTVSGKSLYHVTLVADVQFQQAEQPLRVHPLGVALGGGPGPFQCEGHVHFYFRDRGLGSESN
jgi:hypothetical protein